MTTNEKIDQLLKYYEELEPLKRKESELLNNVKDKNKHNKIKITRNGKELEVEEKVLWLEIYHGADTDAREVLSKKYPEVFQAAEDREKLQNEMLKFAAVELDINPEAIEFKKLINFIISIVDWRLEKTKGV